MAAEAKVTAVIEAKDQMSKVLSDITGNLGTFNTKMLGMAGAIGIAAGAVVKISSDTSEFNQWIARAGANIDATGAQLSEFREIAISATKDTDFSATQAAAALYQLAGGSIDAKDSIEGLQQAVKFATANGIDDLDESVMAVSTVMTLFKLRGEEVSRAMDVLTTAGHEAYGTTQDLVSAFKEAGPASAQLGMSVEELSGLLAGLADAGFVGTEAGVAVKRAIEQLVSPVGDAADDIKQLGLNLKDTNGEFVGLASALDQIEEKTKNMSSMERAAKMSEIFGQIAGPAMTALLNQGSEARQQYIADMNDAAGATDKAAAAIGKADDPLKALNNRFFELETKLAPAANAILLIVIKTVDGLAMIVEGSLNASLHSMNVLWQDFMGAGQFIAEVIFPAMVKSIQPMIDTFNIAVSVATALAKALESVISAASRVASGAAKSVSGSLKGLIPSFDVGGIVPGPTGAPLLAYVHGGERIIPNGGSGSGGGVSVVITGNSINSALDIRDLAEQVGRETMRALRTAQQV